MFVGERALRVLAFDVIRDDPSKIDEWLPFDGDFGFGEGSSSDSSRTP